MVFKHLGLLMLIGKKLFLVYPFSIKPLFPAQAYTGPMRQSFARFPGSLLVCDQQFSLEFKQSSPQAGSLRCPDPQ